MQDNASGTVTLTSRLPCEEEGAWGFGGDVTAQEREVVEKEALKQKLTRVLEDGKRRLDKIQLPGQALTIAKDRRNQQWSLVDCFAL